MRFDNPQYIEVPQDSTLDVGTSDFTFAAWTFLETGSEPNIAMQFAGAGGWRMVGAAGKVRFSVFDNGWSNYASMDISPALTLDQWNHIAVSVDRDGSAQSYINGVAKTSLVVSGVTSTLTNAYPLRFGAGSYTNGAPTGDYIAGTINEAIMYIGTALNAADIAALAATGTNGGPLPPDPTTMTYSTTSYSSSYLKGYWRNDGIVTWADRSGNGNTGTANGSPNALLFKQGINGSKNVNTGRDGQGFPLKYKDVGAIGFNGSNTKVTFNDVDLNLSTGATVSFWCNHSDNTNGAVVGSDDNGYHSYIQPHENGTIYFESSDDSNTATGAMNFTDGFHNYVLVVQGYTATFYEDGVNITTDSSLSTANVSFNYIGTTGAKWFKGSVANLQIYNRVLSYAEIQQNYKAQRSRFT